MLLEESFAVLKLKFVNAGVHIYMLVFYKLKLGADVFYGLFDGF